MQNAQEGSALAGTVINTDTGLPTPGSFGLSGIGAVVPLTEFTGTLLPDSSAVARDSRLVLATLASPTGAPAQGVRVLQNVAPPDPEELVRVQVYDPTTGAPVAATVGSRLSIMVLRVSVPQT